MNQRLTDTESDSFIESELPTTDERLAEELATAEAKAWDALARYKFQMFGYWAAIWVHLNRIEGKKRPNPWKALVHTARNSKETR